jgi:hypothetical protein
MFVRENNAGITLDPAQKHKVWWAVADPTQLRETQSSASCREKRYRDGYCWKSSNALHTITASRTDEFSGESQLFYESRFWNLFTLLRCTFYRLWNASYGNKFGRYTLILLHSYFCSIGNRIFTLSEAHAALGHSNTWVACWNPAQDTVR